MNPTPPTTLPIHQIRPEILGTLQASNRLVLTAPTGSGKTTQVPQFLWQSGFIKGQILVLQPRRLAARLVARRVAEEMGCPLGDLVGYQTRHDSRVSPQTAIRFLTEGLFLRQMQSNPTLEGVGAVILDEFHERNVASDVALALIRVLQEHSRPDLRLVVMSATLDTKLISDYLNCPTLEAHGRLYPVETRYVQQRTQADPWELAADAVADILDHNEPGDVLVFMPGVYEIRRTTELCQRHSNSSEPLAIYPLHAELPAKEQDEALAPSRDRKVIVSTNVAETSITIEGIRHVIDSGLARVNRFDPRRGINVLRVEAISQSSADQRAGRAGRTAAGTCTRLWTELEQRNRPGHETPEIQRLDLAEVLLQLHAMGVADPKHFPWLEAPSELAVEQARRTLVSLGALRDQPDGATTNPLTPMGRQMARFPTHPRLARLLIEASQRHCLPQATLWAALISERDILMRNAKHHFAEDLPAGRRSDFFVLENAFAAAKWVNFDLGRCAAMGINALAARELDKTQRLYEQVAEEAGNSQAKWDMASDAHLESLAKSLLVAFPDHLAVRRSESNLACALAGQRRGELDPQSVAREGSLLLPIEITEIAHAPRANKSHGIAGAATQSIKTVLSLATEIELDWLHDVFPDRITQRRETEFNPTAQVVESFDREWFDDLVISESTRHEADPSAAAEILAEEVYKGNLKLERWDQAVEQWIDRTRCVSEWFPERKLITYNDEERRVILNEICAGAVRYSQIKERPCLQHVKDALSWTDQQFVEQMAPERIQLAAGYRMRMEYTPGQSPRGRAKIQDFYGMSDTPLVGGGRRKVLLEILAPNMRPIQMTDDLANFWKNLYPTVKKELSRRYPRHKWL
ncbi:MAG TPA: ATP-dependent helicase HrpB [Tepidisphaeraceae bacterium]|nr:ATP-dependent helicase HrpB [Tepidisphaeraceae bacterium]